MTPVESKVKAGTAAAAASGLVLWILGRYVFKGDVPDVVASWVYAAVPAAVTFAAGYLAKHTPRPGIQPPAVPEAQPKGMLRRLQVAATHDQILTAVNRLASKVDIVIQQMGITMSQQDEIAADIQTIEAGVAALADSDAQLTTAEQALAALITTLQGEVAAGQPVSQATMDALAKAAADVTAATQANSSVVASVQGLVPPAS